MNCYRTWREMEGPARTYTFFATSMRSKQFLVLFLFFFFFPFFSLPFPLFFSLLVLCVFTGVLDGVNCLCRCLDFACVCVYVSTYLLCGNGVEGVDKRFFFVAAATSHARSDLAASVHPEPTKGAWWKRDRSETAAAKVESDNEAAHQNRARGSTDLYLVPFCCPRCFYNGEFRSFSRDLSDCFDFCSNPTGIIPRIVDTLLNSSGTERRLAVRL